MEPLTKKEFLRISKVNVLKEMATTSDKYKLMYFPGGNLVLLIKRYGKWKVKDQTGIWFEPIFDKVYMQ